MVAVSLKIKSNIPFPNLIKASNIFQPIFPVALSYINDSVVVSQNKSNQNKQKDAPSLYDKVFRSKNRSYTCANRECVGPVGLSSHPQSYGIHHPWIAHDKAFANYYTFNELINHATICINKNHLRHPFPQYNTSMQHVSTNNSSSSLIHKI